ncbi:MAG: putative two-component system response regulatory protein [Bacteroidota bacterium]|jgi:DNA-binding NtrC family response regulator|nr:putative two-component system response regulatory protein [Bacteroidota bacterium]
MEVKHEFKIVVLEDNDFYNNLMTQQIQSYTDEIAHDKGYYFNILSFTNANDCLKNMDPQTDIAFIDFYLGENKNGLDVLKQIKQKSPDCKVVIISRESNLKTSMQTLNEGAYTFIMKDRDALMESCYLIDEIVKERFHPMV